MSTPLVVDLANTVTNPLGLISGSHFIAVADYGALRFHGSGNASTILSNGAFLFLDA
jgi:hypothetical protein